MEGSSKELKMRKVSLPAQHRKLSYRSGRLEKMGAHKSLDHLDKEKPSSSSLYHPLEIPESPHLAMEFLSRSWSPCASDFYPILPSNTLLLPLHENGMVEENDQIQEIEVTERSTTQCIKDTVKRADNIWTWLAAGRSLFPVLQRHRSFENNWMNMSYMKGWLSGKSLTRFSRGGKEKKKDKVRLQTAKIHAAISVAQLAAAIAMFATKDGLATHETNDMASEGGAWNESMGVVVASAATLLAAVCAEAAESAGAHRAHVASAVKSGLATRTSADIITLTATAATCLRGVATLKARVTADADFSKDQEILARGTQISIHTPSGHTQVRMVCIYFKHNRLILRSGKKYLGGLLTTSNEYKIINVIKETKEAQGCYSLCLITSGGNIQLLFKDQKQSYVWKSTVSQLLLSQNSYSITNPATEENI